MAAATLNSNADHGNNTVILPADWELEELVQRLAQSMTPFTYLRILTHAIQEMVGLQSSDPIQRLSGESMVEWEQRRRQIHTARASREYAQRVAPEIDHILVNARNQHFARLCWDAYQRDKTKEEERSKVPVKESSGKPVVCVVGLVHLDGVSEICKNWN